MKKLTLQAIAEAANVSCATVSRCLSGRDGVGEKTRQRVLQLCREMGYNPNFTEAAPHRSGRIGLVCPSLADPMCAKMARELETYLATMDYCLVVAQSHANRQGEQAALQRMAAQHVDGVIVIPISRESRKLLHAMEQPLEAVFLGVYLGDQPESYVAVDHFLGGQAAVRYLLEEGCQRILFVGREESEVSNKRRGGAVSAFRQFRVEGRCADSKDPIDWKDYDGIITADPSIAQQVPVEKRLVSFDGETVGHIDFSTLDSPANMAVIAADILLEKLERPIGGYSHRMVVPELVRREGRQHG